MKLAILVLSPSGLELARKVRGARPDGAWIFGPASVVGRFGETTADGVTFPAGEPGVFGWSGPLRNVFPALWGEYDAIVGVMALGIAVRLAGPLALDKRRDPALVVVDEAGRFALSVLGGHHGGANALTHEIAAAIGAVPVITTASEAQGFPAVDLVGHDVGWVIEHGENLTRVAAAVVRRQTIAVWQDAGDPDWWRPFGPWPDHFVRLDRWEDLVRLNPAAVLVISDRSQVVPGGIPLPPDRTLVYRPKSLVAGVGCKRGTPRATIDAWFEAVLAANGLCPTSLAAVATVTLKADEPGLIAFAEGRGVPLVVFSPDQLDGQPGIETPSEQVRARIGIPAVAEPAALRAANALRLLVPKQKGPGVTLALARTVGGNQGMGGRIPG